MVGRGSVPAEEQTSSIRWQAFRLMAVDAGWELVRRRRVAGDEPLPRAGSGVIAAVESRWHVAPSGGLP